jgi:nucleoredoxin
VAAATPASTNVAPVTSVTTAAAAPSLLKTPAATPAPVNGQPQAVTVSSNSAGQPTGLASELNGHLVTLKDDQIENIDASSLQGVKYWAVYFSASWCPDCVPVTPELVSFYKEFKADHPNFELIMVCHDKTQDAMQAYIKKEEMPWPALRFQDVWNQKLWPLHYIAKGIPNLVLVDSDGKVLSSTYDGTVDHGTDKVIDDIKTLVPAPPTPSL